MFGCMCVCVCVCVNVCVCVCVCIHSLSFSLSLCACVGVRQCLHRNARPLCDPRFVSRLHGYVCVPNVLLCTHLVRCFVSRLHGYVSDQSAQLSIWLYIVYMLYTYTSLHLYVLFYSYLSLTPAFHLAYTGVYFLKKQKKQIHGMWVVLRRECTKTKVQPDLHLTP